MDINLIKNVRIRDIIRSLIGDNYLALVKYTAMNNQLIIRLNTAERIDRPDYSFLDMFEHDDVESVFSRNFAMGKKETGTSFYTIRMRIKPNITEETNDSPLGNILRIIKDRGIETMDEFVTLYAHVVTDLSKLVKIDKKDVSYMERKKIYSLKHQFIKFLYKTDYITDIFFQQGEFEGLVLFHTKIKGVQFHMREVDAAEKIGVYRSNIGVTTGVYTKKNYTEEDYHDKETMFECMWNLQGIVGIRADIQNYFNNK